MYNNVNTPTIVGVGVILAGIVYLGYSRVSNPPQPAPEQPAYSSAGGSRRRSAKHNKSRKNK